MTENVEKRIRALKEGNECCPKCTYIEKCRAHNENGEDRFPKAYEWSKGCCQKCADATCPQNPFYILSMFQNDKEERKDVDIYNYYVEEALNTILLG